MSQEAKNQRQLKNFIINRGYQLKQVFWIATVMLGLSVSFVSVVMIWIRAIFQELNVPMVVDLQGLFWNLVVVVILFVFMSIVFAIVLSHRTAGPMFKFKKVFTEIKEGNLQQRIILRPGDDFREVAEEFNAMMDKVLSKK
jgi:nitrogen fixation/metabolism regulation signal transduction histidine kinase